jgi:hypothetical protein
MAPGARDHKAFGERERERETEREREREREERRESERKIEREKERKKEREREHATCAHAPIAYGCLTGCRERVHEGQGVGIKHPHISSRKSDRNRTRLHLQGRGRDAAYASGLEVHPGHPRPSEEQPRAKGTEKSL